ncbi:uncharacterized protein NEMAJ01_0653 [Nematocida major]|uniref:uncharacterized protein n=1 Tax=Nematocida major TaxID=1912982 RepID=UPI0020080468|nr:uncharacterized protein NEMAJ01_0653 [Nematocida major]KAH9385757.1 hypothetical protein NEMAJ01_0653 [Nematocida major]
MECPYYRRGECRFGEKCRNIHKKVSDLMNPAFWILGCKYARDFGYSMEEMRVFFYRACELGPAGLREFFQGWNFSVVNSHAGIVSALSSEERGNIRLSGEGESVDLRLQENYAHIISPVDVEESVGSAGRWWHDRISRMRNPMNNPMNSSNQMSSMNNSMGNSSNGMNSSMGMNMNSSNQMSSMNGSNGISNGMGGMNNPMSNSSMNNPMNSSMSNMNNSNGMNNPMNNNPMSNNPMSNSMSSNPMSSNGMNNPMSSNGMNNPMNSSNPMNNSMNSMNSNQMSNMNNTPRVEDTARYEIGRIPRMPPK